MPSKTASNSRILDYSGYSDADVNNRPNGPQWHQCSQDWVQKIYLPKVAQRFMEETNQAKPGISYQVERLPRGYEVWERTRPNDHTHIDRFCFGHPSHGQFNSPYDFYPHFKYLMQYNNGGSVCECRFCVWGKAGRKTTSHRSSSKISVVRSRPLGIRGRPTLNRGPMDDEGTPDVVARFLTVLKQEGHIDRRIEERSSMDWRVETIVYQNADHLPAIQIPFAPRIGELVLFHRGIDGELRLNPLNGGFEIWNATLNAFTGHPTWLGGVVTQVPILSEPISLDDIIHETPKKHNVNSSGFRLECYPDPNSRDKSFSKQYNYVPLHHIRPMVFYEDILNGIRTEEWHPTVQNALIAMGSISCVARHQVKGSWPNFTMFCHGLFVGSEALWAGEPIRLMPRGTETAVIDVIIPDCFIVRVLGLEPESDGSITGNRAKKIHLLAVGSVYTIDNESAERQQVKDSDVPQSMREYGSWYHKADAQDKYETGFPYLLGRLYDYDALQQWFPGISPPEALDKGMASTRISRAYAKVHRNDHSGIQLGWFWGEDRANALDLSSFNGIEIGEYDREREPQKWRDILAVLDGLKDRIVEPVTGTNFDEFNNELASRVNASSTTQTDTEDELANVPHDEYDDVIEGYIAGQGFPGNKDGSGPLAKRAKMV